MTRTPKNILRLPMEKRAEMAFKEAVEEVIRRACSLEPAYPYLA
jgi:hypothetical protein